ncbi:MAG TPA: hypothetical protein VF466_01295 [Candidatus Saccharimonadales bacterium]
MDKLGFEQQLIQRRRELFDPVRTQLIAYAGAPNSFVAIVGGTPGLARTDYTITAFSASNDPTDSSEPLLFKALPVVASDPGMTRYHFTGVQHHGEPFVAEIPANYPDAPIIIAAGTEDDQEATRLELEDPEALAEWGSLQMGAVNPSPSRLSELGGYITIHSTVLGYPANVIYYPDGTEAINGL